MYDLALKHSYYFNSYFLSPDSLFTHSIYNTTKMTEPGMLDQPWMYYQPWMNYQPSTHNTTSCDIQLAPTIPKKNTSASAEDQSDHSESGKACELISGLFLIALGAFIIFLTTCLWKSSSIHSEIDNHEVWPWFKVLLVGLAGLFFIIFGFFLTAKTDVTDWGCGRRDRKSEENLPV